MSHYPFDIQSEMMTHGNGSIGRTIQEDTHFTCKRRENKLIIDELKEHSVYEMYV
jgi:hypothetical protein